MEDTKFYPLLTDILPLANIPDNLGFIKDGVESLTHGIHYTDLHIEKSIHGDSASYYVNLILLKKVGFEVPGTNGLALILNPNPAANYTTSIPVSLSYQWDILRYAEGRSLSNVITDPSVYFNLFLDLANTSEKELLHEFVSIVIDDPDPVLKFVNDYNAVNTTTPIALASGSNLMEKIEAIVEHIEDLDQDIFDIVLSQLLSNFNSVEVALEKTKSLFRNLIGQITEEDIQRLLIPRVRASINSIRLALEFPRSIFQPLLPDGTINPDEQVKSQLSFDVGSMSYSTETGFEFANESTFDFPKSAILNSDFTLELHQMKLDLSRTKNIPEAIADGRPLDFVGVYVQDATIGFPAFWNHDAANSTGVIKARNLLIGTGGFSGTLALEPVAEDDSSPLIKVRFGENFSISLDAFSITLKQNAIKESTIKGTLVIPGFQDALGHPAEIRIKVAIRQDGDFDITAHEADGFKEIKCGHIFSIKLASVFFGKRDDDFYIGVSGSIKFTQNLLSGLAPIEVEKLLIWSDGRFEIEGGTIPLPKTLHFPIGPAELSISAIHLGSHQRINANGTTRDFRYFGFDGGLDINPGGVDVRGKGIKFYFPVDLVLDDCYLEIKSIAIDLVIPGSASKESATVLISGFLSVGGTASDPEYTGGITFGLPKMKIAGGASMKYRPRKPAFIVDAFVELSTPIPLGATGLGIYGFRGLFGLRYVATKHAALIGEDQSWFDYYKAKTPPQEMEGVNISKFETPDDMPDNTGHYDNAISIGAGVSLATAQDSGKAFSCKLFLLLSLPDLIYLEGKANILGERVGLDPGVDPPFFAFLAISSQSVETGFGVDYKLPREGSHAGWILDLHAEMRAAFFFKNSAAWYINFGTIEKPTTARVLSMFDATSYVMLSASGIRAGAGITFGFDKSYAGGVVRASVGVYIKVGGFISFERPQIGGFAMLGGHVNVSLLWVSFYLVIDTSLSVEAPKPFYVQGSVHLCVGVTIGFWKFKKHIEKCFDVEFKWEKDNTVDTTPVLPLKDLQANPSALPPMSATNMLSGETFGIAFLGTTVPSANSDGFKQAVLPLDTWVDLEFLKGLLPEPNVDERIGRLSGQAPANTIDFVPPAEVAHKVKHQYAIKALEIKAWSGSAWVDYRPYQAMTPPGALNAPGTDPSAYKDGFWQNTGGGFNKVRLLAETSLSYMQQGEPEWYIPEQFGITSATLFCRTKLRERLCLRWADIAPGTVWPDGVWQQLNTVLWRVSGGPGTVIEWNSPAGIPRSLGFANEDTAQLVFNKPCVEVSLKLTTFSTGAVIRFYKRETVGAGFAYTLVETRSLTQLQLLAPVEYHNPAVPVAKVEIDPRNADPATVHAMQLRIDSMYRLLYESDLDPQEQEDRRAKIRSAEQELAQFTAQGCTPKGIDSGTLIQALTVLEEQVGQCHAQLVALQVEQEAACSEAAESSTQFLRCFPQEPSKLSYEVVREEETRYRFHIYDDATDSLLLNSFHQYTDPERAQTAMLSTLELALWPEAYQPVITETKQFFFQLVNPSGVVAVNPVLFDTKEQLDEFVAQTQGKMRLAHEGGRFELGVREAGKLPCDVCLEHLACWQELSGTSEEDDERCRNIVAGILTGRDLFCSEYNVMYRLLYACQRQLLNEATGRCEELTRELEIKRAECHALAEQLEAIRHLIIFIDEHGTILPPETMPCSTLLQEACWLSLEDYEFNLSVPSQEAIMEDYGSAVQAIEKRLTPIWRPDTKYYVHLQVTDTVNNTQTQDSHFYFGFRAAGPVGYFHTDQNANYVKPEKSPDQYMLTSLKGYIDYQRSYPKADGQLIGAKPLFYEDARILLFFTKRYTYHFFGDWPAYNGLPAISGSAMQVIIKDPAENISIPNPPPPQVMTTEIPQAVTSWPQDNDPRIPEDIRMLLNLRNPELLNPDFEGGDCWPSGGDMIKPASVYTQVMPQYLKPLKLYTAVVNNVYRTQIREVHRYVFQTSRYADFAAQVNSYHLDDGKGNQRDAIFRIDMPLPVTDINLMYDIVTGNMMSAPNAALAGIWADPFDRLVEGVLKLTPLDAPVSTEFNIVRNSMTNAVIAVWIRSPEPFNDPKLPDDVLPRSLRVMPGASPDLNYKILFSKDCSQVFVMHPSKIIPVTQMRFRFAYIEWNGSTYVNHTLMTTGVIHMNI